MSIAELIRAMASAGAPPEAIAIAVEAIEGKEAEIQARRAAARDRKRRQRAGQSRDSHATVTRQSQDIPSPRMVPSSVSPDPSNSTPLNPPAPVSLRSTPAREAAEIDREFNETFWPAYPNKVGKPKAMAAFRAARRAAPLSEILAGLDRYIAEKPADRQWLNPTTFLNQARWADEPAAVAVNGHARAPPEDGGYTQVLHAIQRSRQLSDEPPDKPEDPEFDLRH